MTQENVILEKGIDLDSLKAGNRRSLAKAISLIESTNDADRELSQRVIENILPYTGRV